MKKKKSLTRQIMLMIACLVSAAIAGCWVLNVTLLERYYIQQKKADMVSSYEILSDASETGELESADFDVTFENICAKGNVTIIVLSEDNVVVRTSAADMSTLREELLNTILAADQAKVVQTEDHYQLLMKTDTRLHSEYLVLVGELGNGDNVLMRTALESLKASAGISNRFLLFVGLIAIVISCIAGGFMARWITRPILQLTDISKKMVRLDFNAKYVHGGWKKDPTLNVKGLFNRRQLAVIQGYAEGLKECINDDAESRDFYCDVIIDESAKMNRMVKKLLTLNQLEFGNDQVVMERFEITELVRGVANASRILMEQGGISFEIEETDELYVWGDEFKVEEVVTNYLSNAINHCEGEKKIRVFYTKKENLLRISVYNTGRQIPEADIGRIWEKFYKVDKARTREYGGSGIGLSIVKAIMDSFHRECGVINREDGVEFWLELEMR